MMARHTAIIMIVPIFGNAPGTVDDEMSFALFIHISSAASSD